jgi:hypothetical protein
MASAKPSVGLLYNPAVAGGGGGGGPRVDQVEMNKGGGGV